VLSSAYFEERLLHSSLNHLRCLFDAFAESVANVRKTEKNAYFLAK
jgi:hypothetical protein